MPRRQARLVIRSLLLGALALAACETPPQRVEVPQVTYKHQPPLRFDVAEIVVEQLYRPPLQAPNVEHLFAVGPADLAARWAADRLVAGGATGRLRYLVREASVIETPLARKDGLEGVLKVEQSERYDARLLVEVELLDGFGTRQGRVEVEATRSNTIAENAALRERERLWFEMAEQLTGDMGQALEAKLREVMGLHLLR